MPLSPKKSDLSKLLQEKAEIIKLLEESNAELAKRNEVLDSFNRFVSHDLQEPLRKIQTFISRIEDMEDVNLPEQASDYFGRIKKSAGRMQKLIQDLLVFSYSTATEKDFEPISFNEIVRIAFQEMAEEISEKNAKIHLSPLPEGEGIPFQLVQLFKNLLSNSLKYAQPDIAPEIHVQEESVKEADSSHFKGKSPDSLIKISFRDNGIGFEQKHAQLIFELFKRLHGKDDFSGTGIGLTICQKIMENHQGTIYATSAPNQGATFTILLPKKLS